MWKFTVGNELGLYENPEFKFKDGVNVLIGPNGTGKSFLLDRISEKSHSKNEDNDYLVISYSNLRDGGNIATQKFLDEEDITSLAHMITSSEGQGMYHAFGTQFFKKLKTKLIDESTKDKKRSILVLTIDSMDSGLDIYTMKEIINFFDETLICELSKQYDFLKTVVAIISTNAYEFAKGREVIDVLTGKTMKFDSYEQYADHIIETAEKVFERNKKLNEKKTSSKILKRGK